MNQTSKVMPTANDVQLPKTENNRLAARLMRALIRLTDRMAPMVHSKAEFKARFCGAD